MTDDERYVTRREWHQYQEYCDQMDLQRRIDRLERIIDRYTGPVVITIVALGAIGAASSVITLLSTMGG